MLIYNFQVPAAPELRKAAAGVTALAQGANALCEEILQKMDVTDSSSVRAIHSVGTIVHAQAALTESCLQTHNLDFKPTGLQDAFLCNAARVLQANTFPNPNSCKAPMHIIKANCGKPATAASAVETGEEEIHLMSLCELVAKIQDKPLPANEETKVKKPKASSGKRSQSQIAAEEEYCSKVRVYYHARNCLSGFYGRHVSFQSPFKSPVSDTLNEPST